MGAVIAPADMSTTIIIDIFRDGLRSALTDPKADSRPTGSQFVVTSFPRRPVYYPIIVVEESGDDAKRLDRRVDMRNHNYQVSIIVHAETNTDMYSIRDAIRAWFEDNYESIQDDGYTDSEQLSSTPITWDDTADIKSWQIIFTGVVYTSSAP